MLPLTVDGRPGITTPQPRCGTLLVPAHLGRPSVSQMRHTRQRRRDRTLTVLSWQPRHARCPQSPCRHPTAKRVRFVSSTLKRARMCVCCLARASICSTATVSIRGCSIRLGRVLCVVKVRNSYRLATTRTKTHIIRTDFSMLVDDDEEYAPTAQSSRADLTTEGSIYPPRRRPLTHLFRFKRRSSAPAHSPLSPTPHSEIPPVPPVPISTGILG
jgi:hypothetical protein